MPWPVPLCLAATGFLHISVESFPIPLDFDGCLADSIPCTFPVPLGAPSGPFLRGRWCEKSTSTPPSTFQGPALPQVPAQTCSPSLRPLGKGGVHHTRFTEKEAEVCGNQGMAPLRSHGPARVQHQANCSSPHAEMTDFKANCGAVSMELFPK